MANPALDVLQGLGYAINNVGSLANIGTGIANTVLQFQNYDYQKALQQQIFDREDTSYQRQVADLEKAGLNKYAVQGGANAGSVVSTSAPQFQNINTGALLDTVKSIKELKLLDEQTKHQRIQNINDSNISDINGYKSTYNLARSLYEQGYRGLSIHKQSNDDGSIKYNIFYDTENGDSNITGLDKVLSKPITEAELLNLDSSFYTSDKVMQYLAPILKLFK